MSRGKRVVYDQVFLKKIRFFFAENYPKNKSLITLKQREAEPVYHVNFWIVDEKQLVDFLEKLRVFLNNHKFRLGFSGVELKVNPDDGKTYIYLRIWVGK